MPSIARQQASTWRDGSTQAVLSYLREKAPIAVEIHLIFPCNLKNYINNLHCYACVAWAGTYSDLNAASHATEVTAN
jgi:hypothetical protein